MVARSESLDRKVEDTPANCLMLLSRVGECDGGDAAETRVFRCKTCMKEFSSFQALRGHRVSHKKPVNSSGGEEQTGIVAKKKTEKTGWHHRCSICGLEFPMGQALGGHMRKHWNKEDSGGALVTRSLFPEAAMTRTLKETSEGKEGVAYLESGSDWVDGINLKLELGRTMY
ncbi:Zinc finger protein ZAT8 [Raphanus sativus]|uniref:Zinc finger protein ZAT8 n=1 Tax=Raphanus sativus TaxID=3726 RepID=A0A6J0NZ41_RAPSA|nr:zinc finger protein ZAT8 [Raphanus sativus]KAJ4895659.1 Zinc finger protein ZAT8 [Raphanus sativus]